MNHGIGTRVGMLAAVLFVFMSVFSPAHAANYYVAANGDNFSAGTISAPWKTIDHAVNSVAAGDTVYVRAGTYFESVTFTVSGSQAQGHVTLCAYPGETPVVDGTGLAVVDAMGLLNLRDISHVTISGFEIRNLSSTSDADVPMGIFVSGASHHIRIDRNLIHSIQNTARDGNAHGIGVYGDNASASLNEITIHGNEITGCVLGWSETVVLNGNVENFRVENNLIHHNDNIGIDFIGHEGTCSDPEQDMARDGICAGNTVHDIDSSSNPAYGGDTSAGGIYVDGGTRIVIERNHVYSCNIGIEAASENPGKYSEHVIIRNNFVHDNDIMGIAVGGYNASVGGSRNCQIVHNTLYHNDTFMDGNGEILLQHDTSDITIKNNILWTNQQNLFIVDAFGTSDTNSADFNLFFSPGGEMGSQWQWKGVYYEGFDQWKSATNNDANSIFSDPLLTEPSSGDLHITTNSPARDTGTNLFSTLGGLADFDQDTRIQNSVADMGADEYNGVRTLHVETGGICHGKVQCHATAANAIMHVDSQMLNRIKLRKGHYEENVVLNTGGTVWIIGGFDNLFETEEGQSFLKKLELRNVELTVKNIALWDTN